MTSSLRNITVDCTDARALARFWAAVLGWNIYYGDDDPEGNDFCVERGAGERQRKPRAFRLAEE